MSSLSASATSASASPVAGLGVVKVLPDSASTQCPSISSWYLRVVLFSAGCTDDIMTPLVSDKLEVCRTSKSKIGCAGEYLPENVRKNSAVLVIVDLNRCVDAQCNRNCFSF